MHVYTVTTTGAVVFGFRIQRAFDVTTASERKKPAQYKNSARHV